MMLKRNRTTTHRKIKQVAQRDPYSSQHSCLIIVSRFWMALGIYYRKDFKSFFYMNFLYRKKSISNTECIQTIPHLFQYKQQKICLVSFMWQPQKRSIVSLGGNSIFFYTHLYNKLLTTKYFVVLGYIFEDNIF